VSKNAHPANSLHFPPDPTVRGTERNEIHWLLIMSHITDVY
jgi:hypothetical protein